MAQAWPGDSATGLASSASAIKEYGALRRTAYAAS